MTGLSTVGGFSVLVLVVIIIPQYAKWFVKAKSHTFYITRIGSFRYCRDLLHVRSSCILQMWSCVAVIWCRNQYVLLDLKVTKWQERSLFTMKLCAAKSHNEENSGEYLMNIAAMLCKLTITIVDVDQSSRWIMAKSIINGQRKPVKRHSRQKREAMEFFKCANRLKQVRITFAGNLPRRRRDV